MRFYPFVNIATTSVPGMFRIWFELGKKGQSEWHGVYLQKTAAAPFIAGSGDLDLLPISASALVFNQNNANEFSNYSVFKGQMSETGQVTIWHEVLQREQTTTAQDIIRIEAGRDLSCKYDPNSDTVNSFPFNVILQEAYSVAPTLALAAALSTLLF